LPADRPARLTRSSVPRARGSELEDEPQRLFDVPQRESIDLAQMLDETHAARDVIGPSL
jgi:hypothetical protein